MPKNHPTEVLERAVRMTLDRSLSFTLSNLDWHPE